VPDRPQTCRRGAPRGAQGNVDQAPSITNQIFDGLVGGETILQKLRAAIQDLPEDDRRELPLPKGLGRGVR